MSGVGQLIGSGPLLLALPVAAAAGAVTFLSPCCLPLVPGYLSFVTGMAGTGGTARTGAAAGAGGMDAAGTTAAGTAKGTGVAVVTPPAAPPAPPRSRVVAGTALFVLGFSLVFVAYGAAFGSLGHLLTGHAREVTRVLGGVTILLGLLFAGAFDRFTFAGRIVKPSARPKAGLAGAPLLGAMFGLGWTPCTGPTLSVVMALSASTGTAARGAVLAFVYAFGLGVPFLLMSFGFQRSMRAFEFARRHTRLVTRIGGAMLICVGLLEVTGAWYSFITWLQTHWAAGYQLPL
ncbi:MAG: sulfite exporter TauE/SafE family protein [Streptosporangiaceae bacterium]|nr:sulfite exporter TauE/SafE family protein [Streptosporangiaceae bacterium]